MKGWISAMRNFLLLFLLLCPALMAFAADQSLEGDWYFIGPDSYAAIRLSFSKGKFTANTFDTRRSPTSGKAVSSGSYIVKPGNIIHLTFKQIAPDAAVTGDGDYHYTLTTSHDEQGHQWQGLRIPKLLPADNADPTEGIWFGRPSKTK